MRIGKNPQLDQQTDLQKREVTVCILSHIPAMAGYFEQSLRILQICIESARENTKIPFHLLVFDNASCAETQDYLQSAYNAGLIDILIQSKENFGKTGAFNKIFSIVDTKILSYADGDVFFGPEWLEKQLLILNNIPNIGIVTGMPRKQYRDVYTAKGLLLAEKSPNIYRIDKGNFISEESMRIYCLGVGKNFDEYFLQFKDQPDIRISAGNVQAILGAGHFQFTGYADTFKKIIPFENETRLSVQEDVQLDSGVDNLELLRLSTPDVTIYHMGNSISQHWFEEIGFPEWGEANKHLSLPTTIKQPLIRRLSRNRYIKPFGLRLYRFLHRLYVVQN